MLNCRPGDLAIVIHAEQPKNLGTLVHVIRLLDRPNGSWWEVDPVTRGKNPRIKYMAADSSLRPIRDPGDDAQDETLSWIESPCVGAA